MTSLATKARGVIYVAKGEKYIDEACRSAASLKVHLPELPVTLFSDVTLERSCFDSVISISSSPYSIRDKAANLAYSPYEHTLYLDSDTYVADDISELFHLLDVFDLAAAHAPARRAFQVNDVPGSFPEFNAGVILFKKSSKILGFLDQWLELYDRNIRKEAPPGIPKGKIAERYPFRDQPSFREALYHSDLRIATLTPEYNCRIGSLGYINGPVKILHGRHPRLSELASQLNQKTHQRVHLMDADVLKVLTVRDVL